MSISDMANKPLEVLIVDDSPAVRAVLSMCLRLSKIPILDMHEAENGEAALSVLRQRPIDLVFTDMNMPIMNGRDLILRMQADARHRFIPIVVVSYVEDPGVLQGLLGCGVKSIMRKPFTPEAVANVVRKIVSPQRSSSSAPVFAAIG